MDEEEEDWEEKGKTLHTGSSSRKKKRMEPMKEAGNISSDEDRKRENQAKDVQGTIGSRICKRKSKRDEGNCLSISSDDSYGKKIDELGEDINVDPIIQEDEPHNPTSEIDMHYAASSTYGNPWTMRKDMDRPIEKMHFLKSI